MKRLLMCGLPVLALFVMLSAAPAFAATATANLTIQATVNASCTINAATINLGAYDPTGAHFSSPLDGQGTFTLRCTRGTAATIDLSLGANASGTTRRMINGADVLDYELYRDAARTATWGSGANSLNPYQADPGGVAPNSGNRTITVYGQIPGGQMGARSGLYTDTVVATVNY